jgi:hypothetical protein
MLNIKAHKLGAATENKPLLLRCQLRIDHGTISFMTTDPTKKRRAKARLFDE